ncbi:MAG: septal ring lytic transglycosylase RlpA family protein [Chthoniobacterales bacterium]
MLFLLARTRSATETSVAGTSAPPGHYGYASWYEVPVDSLAHRRAGEDEFTAASDKLPLGTRVRVTNPENHKTVTVRVTDKGIHNRHIQLDLSKEAASELEILRAGVARVRMEVLPSSEDAAPAASVSAIP